MEICFEFEENLFVRQVIASGMKFTEIRRYDPNDDTFEAVEPGNDDFKRGLIALHNYKTFKGNHAVLKDLETEELERWSKVYAEQKRAGNFDDHTFDIMLAVQAELNERYKTIILATYR